MVRPIYSNFHLINHLGCYDRYGVKGSVLPTSEYILYQSSREREAIAIALVLLQQYEDRILGSSSRLVSFAMQLSEVLINHSQRYGSQFTRCCW